MTEQLAAAAATPSAESQSAAKEAEPEAAYEQTRSKKVKEAVKEETVSHGAETSGMHSLMHRSIFLLMLRVVTV